MQRATWAAVIAWRRQRHRRKAAAALLTNPGDPFDYLEVIGGKPPPNAPAPFIAIPTTAGRAARSRATPCSPHRAPRQGQPAFR